MRKFLSCALFEQQSLLLCLDLLSFEMSVVGSFAQWQFQTVVEVWINYNFTSTLWRFNFGGKVVRLAVIFQFWQKLEISYSCSRSMGCRDKKIPNSTRLHPTARSELFIAYLAYTSQYLCNFRAQVTE